MGYPLFLIIIFIISLILSFILVKITSKLFYKLNILDNPTKYGHNRKPIPHSMGVILFILFFILSFIFVRNGLNIELYHKLQLIWIFGFIITLVSFLDDFYFLSPKLRLLIQIFIASIIGITSIKIGYIGGLFDGIIDLDSYYIDIYNYRLFIVSIIFTIIWYVFIFNALNWTDGIPGNTAGISIISFFIIFLLGIKLYLTDDYIGGVENATFIIVLSTILIGILSPFWYFNLKTRFLMGDSGTMFLGFMLASLAIISGGKIATTLTVFGLYSVDAIYVILKRLKNKKSPFLGDHSHLHYRLQNIGMSNKQILSTIYSLSFVFGFMSLFLNKIGKIILFLFIIFFVLYLPKIISKFFIKNEK